ncbi:MAG: type IV secretion system protein [Sphingomonas sp.]|nr:type IV secretion system protein [Sphingomonas sp.]
MTPNLCTPPGEDGLIAQLLADTDCQAFGLVERGYGALSAPGGSVAALLTSLMVIAVAFYGYRLMLGRGLAIAEVTTLAVKFGVVLLIAVSWSTWQSIAYDTLARAPSRLASELIVAIDAPAPLTGVQSALDRIEAGNVGWRTRAGIASPLVGGAPTAAMALNVSAFLLTLSTVGMLVVSRIVLALLLAIAPVMAGFLLFDATRGLLEGWLRAMLAAALVPLGVLTLSAIELSILNPMIDRMLAQQAANVFEVSDVTPVALVAIIFALAMVATVRALRTISRGLRLMATASSNRAADIAMPQPFVVTERTVAGGGRLPASALPVSRALESAARRDSEAGASRTVAAALRAGGVAPSSLSTARDAPANARQSSTIEPSRTRLVPPRRALPRASRAASRRDS